MRGLECNPRAARAEVLALRWEPLLAFSGLRPERGPFRVEAQGAFHVEALIQWALRLAGDRVLEVDDAWGEIVTHLEFEVKTHLEIRDSGALLEAVDQLRAMIER